MQDTVEKDVEGMAEKIVAEDEQRRAQELVSGDTILRDAQLSAPIAGRVQHRTETAELGPQKGDREKACKA